MNSSMRIYLSTTLLAWSFVGCDTSTRQSGLAVDPANPGPAMEAALEVREPMARVERLASLLQSLGPEGLPTAQEILEDQRRYLGSAEHELLLRYWARHAPEHAATWAFTHPVTGVVRMSVGVGATIEEWARRDPQGALVAVQESAAGSDPVSRSAQVQLIIGWFESGNPGLADYVRDLGPSIRRQRAVATYINLLILKEGSDAAMRWAEGLPEEDKQFKLAVYRQVAGALAVHDRAAAEAWCEAHCDGPFGGGLRIKLVNKWLTLDPDSAPELIEELAREPERKDAANAMRHGLVTWARYDREAAMAWMAEKTSAEPPEPWVPLLYANYAELVAEDSPEEAMKWALLVENEPSRKGIVVRVGRIWRARDEAAAEAWLEEAAIPEDMKRKIRTGRVVPRSLPAPTG